MTKTNTVKANIVNEKKSAWRIIICDSFICYDFEYDFSGSYSINTLAMAIAKYVPKFPTAKRKKGLIKVRTK